MLAAGLLSAPVIVPTIWMHVTDHHDALWLMVPGGLVYGALLVWAGLRIAAGRTARPAAGDPGGGQQG